MSEALPQTRKRRSFRRPPTIPGRPASGAEETATSDATPHDVRAYINAAPEATRPVLRQLRRAIRAAVPDAEKISSGMPSYQYHGRLAYFAAHTHHVGLYARGPAGSLPQKLQQYAAAKGTLRFPLGEALPIAAIGRLIKARASEREATRAPQIGSAVFVSTENRRWRSEK